MRLVRANGLIAGARRFLAGSGNVSEDEVRDPSKMAEILRSMTKRIADIESRTPPEPIEFEVTVGAGGAVTSLRHNFGAPVRYYVVSWCRVDGVASPTAAPILVRDDTSTPDVLVLRSFVSGRAIVRVEQTFADIDMGVNAGDVVTQTTQYTKMLAGQVTVSGVSLAATNLTFPIGANELWAIDFHGEGHASTTAGMVYGLLTPSGATTAGVLFSSSTNVSAANWISFAVTAPNVGIGTCHAGATDAGRFDWANIRVKNGANPGTVSIAIAGASAGVVGKLDAKAFMRATLVTEV